MPPSPTEKGGDVGPPESHPRWGVRPWKGRWRLTWDFVHLRTREHPWGYRVIAGHKGSFGAPGDTGVSLGPQSRLRLQGHPWGTQGHPADGAEGWVLGQEPQYRGQRGETPRGLTGTLQGTAFPSPSRQPRPAPAGWKRRSPPAGLSRPFPSAVRGRLPPGPGPAARTHRPAAVPAPTAAAAAAAVPRPSRAVRRREPPPAPPPAPRHTDP